LSAVVAGIIDSDYQLIKKTDRIDEDWEMSLDNLSKCPIDDLFEAIKIYSYLAMQMGNDEHIIDFCYIITQV
jgi:hypothetical protein